MTTSTRPRNLLDLPPELLAAIVNLLVPDYSPEPGAYSERCKIGRGLSLVCRALRPVAQAKLREVCEAAPFARSDGQLAPEFKPDVRTAVIRQKVPLSRDISSVLTGCTALRDLRISWNERVDLSLLAELPNLQRLILYSVSLLAPRPFSFPRLVEFSCQATYAHTDHPLITLDRSFFPKLQALALSNFERNLEEDGPALVPAENLLDALTAFVFLPKHNTEDTSLVRLMPFTNTVLREVHFETCEFLTRENLDNISPFQHFRLYSNCDAGDHAWLRWEESDSLEEGTRTVSNALRGLARELDRRPSPLAALKSLYLPIELSPDLSSDESDGDLLPRIRLAREQLDDACRNAQVALVYEAFPKCDVDSLVSPAFWERCKAVKA
ncbi:hypothetical protein JCM6882_002697 [Rhodosporidiobolus microsporus]